MSNDSALILLQDELLDIARRSITHGLKQHRPLPLTVGDCSPPLREPRACFVTLLQEGQLRGCIGSLEAREALGLNVAHNAYGAAFQDPRFTPLRSDEFASLEIHISILSPPEPLAAESETALLAMLRPGIDGLIIEDHGYRATFLPSVWEQLPDPRLFLQQLKLKAGLAPDYWSPTLRAQRYQTLYLPTARPADPMASG
jgi:AmmeMemoRadiSam system protein A